MSKYEHDPKELEDPCPETLKICRDLMHKIALSSGLQFEGVVGSRLVEILIEDLQKLPKKIDVLEAKSYGDVEKAIKEFGEDLALSEIDVWEDKGKKTEKETRYKYRTDSVEKTIFVASDNTENETKEEMLARRKVEEAERKAKRSTLSEKEVQLLNEDLERIWRELNGGSEWIK